MAFDDLLPDRFDVLEIGEDVVAGRTVEVETVIALDQAGRLVDRDPADVVHDAAGSVLVEADLLTRYPLALGHAVRLTDGRRYLVTGRPKRRRRAVDDHHVSAPVRTG